MRKTMHVAWREFTTTVMTRAFLLAVLLPPILMGGVFALMPILMNQAAPKVSGRIAVLDKSGRVAPRLEGAFTPEKMRSRHGDKTKEQLESAPKVPGLDPAKQAEQAAAMTQVVTQLTLEALPLTADVEDIKKQLATVNAKVSGPDAQSQRLVLAVIPEEAVRGDKLTGFEMFLAPKLDVEVQKDIEGQIAKAIVDARIEESRLDVAKVRGLIERPEATAMVMTAGGQRKTNVVAGMLVPGAFMFLLWISVFTAGQYLLTTTIEEKSNRVMEVLLSAVSPLQLMVGKIFGQMAVGGVILVAYAGLGMVGLAVASMNDLIDPMNLVYLCIYFLIAFFLVASMMAAVGSAVSDVREAQSLLGPIMIVLVIPMMLWLPILRNPNSVFAQVVSFVPPISPFVMVLRLSGSEPVPLWQIPATIVLGIIYAIIAAWAAAKIFRIGVLMYGKPPNFATLIRWIKMA